MPDAGGRGPHATLVVDGGREIAYDVYGDPDGPAVLNCHGGLLCRTDVAPADTAARELGLRIVSPDRPGVGASGRHPLATTSEWVDDATALADHLGLDRFAVMGWSLGGQYALALGAALPARVTRVAAIAGCVPLDVPARFAELSTLDRTLARLSRRATPLARAAFATMGFLARSAPRSLARSTVRGSTRAEAAAVLAASDWLQEATTEGLAHPRGAVDEYRTFVAPWGFAPEDVAVPVDIWQGSADTLVPEAWAHELAARIPDAELHLLEGEGHMIGLTRRADVLAALAP